MKMEGFLYIHALSVWHSCSSHNDAFYGFFTCCLNFYCMYLIVSFLCWLKVLSLFFFFSSAKRSFLSCLFQKKPQLSAGNLRQTKPFFISQWVISMIILYDEPRHVWCYQHHHTHEVLHNILYMNRLDWKNG